MKILSSSTLWHFDMFFFSGKDLIYHCRREGARRGVRTLGRLVEAPDLEALLPGQSVETSQGWSLRGLSALPIPSSRGGCLDWILPPGPLLNPLWAAIIAPKVRQANLISNLFFFFFPFSSLGTLQVVVFLYSLLSTWHHLKALLLHWEEYFDRAQNWKAGLLVSPPAMWSWATWQQQWYRFEHQIVVEVSEWLQNQPEPTY